MNIVGGVETDAPVDVRVSIGGLSVPCPMRYDGKGPDGRFRWRAYAPVTPVELIDKELIVTAQKPPAEGHDLIVELSSGNDTAPPWARFPVEGCNDCLWGTHHCRTCTDYVDHGEALCTNCGEIEDGEEATG